jgi:hypothetical protein
MEQAHRPVFQPIEAGAILAGTVAACGAIGALAGWALGSPGLALVAGVMIGIPVAVFTVYRRFRESFR